MEPFQDSSACASDDSLVEPASDVDPDPAARWEVGESPLAPNLLDDVGRVAARRGHFAHIGGVGVRLLYHFYEKSDLENQTWVGF